MLRRLFWIGIAINLLLLLYQLSGQARAYEEQAKDIAYRNLSQIAESSKRQAAALESIASCLQRLPARKF